MSELSINTDGGARGNPGPAAIGVVFKSGDFLETHERCIGTATNNVAEYTGVLDALNLMPEIIGRAGQISSLHFYLDSQLVVMQITGKYKIKEPSLQELCRQIRIKLQEIGLPYSFTHVPRAQNSMADKLVNHALDAAASH